MSSPQHPGGASFEPRLVSDTRKALAVLYSFPTAATTTRAAAGGRPLTPHEAHDFLLNMQSKNVRRRIQSLGQRQRDHRDPQQAHASLQEERLPMGSTWLACLAILCHSQSFTAQSTTEQLFCAQTLLHRLRRIRLVEAIDWELEQPTAESSYFQAFAIYESNLVDSLVPFYISLIHSIHPIIGSVLAAHSAASSSSSSSYTEERAKGELSVMTIASLIYLTVLSGYHDSQTIPLLSTLSAALATIVLRLRFVNNEGQQQDGTTTTNATCPPMVDSIIQAFHSVHHILSTRVGGASSSSSAPFLSSLQTCLSVLPDTVLGSPGGARGRLSMDPRGIQAATVELCTMGLATLQETLRQYQQYASTGLEEQLVDYWVLCICLEWAKYVPLSTDFVQQIAPLMNKHLTVNETRHQKVVTALMIALFEGAALPESELLARRVGLSDSQLPSPPQKKRQTSRSKQRKMGLIESSMTNEMLEEIQQEARMRGESACIVALFTWDNFSAATNHALTACSDNPTATVQGEGPIGCLAAAANACLPFLLKNPGFHHSQDLFFGLAKSFQRLCQSPNKSVRGLAYEPLYTLKESLESLDSRHNGASLGDEINALVVDHFFQVRRWCSRVLRLAHILTTSF